MRKPIDRRAFLETGARVALVPSIAQFAASVADAAEPVRCAAPNAEALGWPIACQLYTFRQFPFYEALERIASLGFRHVEPCFFLPLDKQRPQLKANENLAPAVRTELKQRLADRGITISNYYAQLGTDQAAARKVFEFAKEMGAATIVAEPPAEAFDMIEQLCDRYGVNLAVHNHPKSPRSKYWQPENVLAVCNGRSKRIGACCDTGHWVRSGLKPVDCLKKMEGRIVTMHLKDVAQWGEPAARDVPLGTGKADYGAVLEELYRQRFRGVLSIEYEHQSPELADEVAQCVAFVENTVRSHRWSRR